MWVQHLGIGIIFRVTVVPSSCFWDATVWVSYEVGLGEIAFLWLLVNLSDMNCWTGQTGSDSICSICPEGSANGPV